MIKLGIFLFGMTLTPLLAIWVGRERVWGYGTTGSSVCDLVFMAILAWLLGFCHGYLYCP